jgi:hypothetical protein
MPALWSLRLAALAAAARSAAAQCAGAPFYTLGGLTQSCCAAGFLQANAVAAGAGCVPVAATASGPVDATFALSGRAAEGLGAFATTGTIAFGGDALGNANAALELTAPATITASGAALSAALPAPGGANGASVSAWVKCGAPGNTAAQTTSTVVQWANPASVSSTATRLGLQATTGGMSGTRGSIAQVLASPDVNSPRAGVVDRNGVLYISSTSGNKIVKYTIATATATPLVGSGTAGKANGVGVAATLTTPAGMVLSQNQQTLYWAEYGGSFSVRQVNLTTLQTSTFVGNGAAGYVEGIGTAAGFVYPYALDIDFGRNIMYVADASNYRIRAVNMATRQTSTFVGNGANGRLDGTGSGCTLYPYSITVQQATGNLFVADPVRTLARGEEQARPPPERVRARAPARAPAPAARRSPRQPARLARNSPNSTTFALTNTHTAFIHPSLRCSADELQHPLHHAGGRLHDARGRRPAGNSHLGHPRGRGHERTFQLAARSHARHLRQSACRRPGQQQAAHDHAVRSGDDPHGPAEHRLRDGQRRQRRGPLGGVLQHALRPHCRRAQQHGLRL